MVLWLHSHAQTPSLPDAAAPAKQGSGCCTGSSHSVLGKPPANCSAAATHHPVWDTTSSLGSRRASVQGAAPTSHLTDKTQPCWTTLSAEHCHNSKLLLPPALLTHPATSLSPAGASPAQTGQCQLEAASSDAVPAAVKCSVSRHRAGCRFVGKHWHEVQ